MSEDLIITLRSNTRLLYSDGMIPIEHFPQAIRCILDLGERKMSKMGPSKVGYVLDLAASCNWSCIVVT